MWQDSDPWASLRAALDERGCEIPKHKGWSVYAANELVEEAAEEEERGQTIWKNGPPVERAGAPPFDHNLALYEMDSMLMPGSGLPGDDDDDDDDDWPRLPSDDNHDDDVRHGPAAKPLTSLPPACAGLLR